MKLSVVIPSYNESENIVGTVTDLVSRIEGIVETYEIIVVDDHSTDDTFEQASSMKDVAVHCLRLSRRSGSHVAIRVGLAATSGDAVLCISADGQDDPEVVGLMLGERTSHFTERACATLSECSSSLRCSRTLPHSNSLRCAWFRVPAIKNNGPSPCL